MFAFARAPQRFEPRSATAQALLEHAGKMTYPLYLTHALLGAGLMRMMIGAGVNGWTALAIAILAVLSLASLIAQFGEPFVRGALRMTLDGAERALKRMPSVAFLFAPGGAVAAPRAEADLARMSPP
jgi:peptidoglycan/LPS O-acetylase OafA/YrhL